MTVHESMEHSHNEHHVPGGNEPDIPVAAASYINPDNDPSPTPFSSALQGSSYAPTAAPSAPPSPHVTGVTTTYTVPPPTGGGVNAAGPTAISTTANMNLGRDPKSITCPFCNQRAVTRTSTKVDCFSIVMAVIVFLLFWPLFWLPLVIPSCKTTEHYCGSCHRRVSQTKPCE